MLPDGTEEEASPRGFPGRGLDGGWTEVPFTAVWLQRSFKASTQSVENPDTGDGGPEFWQEV